MIDKSKFKNKKEWRKFGIALAAFLFLLATVLYIRHSEAYLYLSGAGLFISLSALAFPWLIKPLFIFFSYFGYVMGWIVTRIILILFFYLFITPFSLLLRLFGKRFLDLQFPGQKTSYWINSENMNESERNVNHYEVQY